MLRLEDLAKSYGGVRAVDGVSFSIAAGTITGLIGPNGAGKTTTFNMIAGAETPTSGRILFQDQDITGVATHELCHRGIVRTFQLPKEFAKLTVLENLMAAAPNQYGENIWANWLAPSKVRTREAEVRAQAEQALDFLTLSHLADELAGNLSGGQKKLLELGRTMMTDAKLVLLDEPGAGVNPTLMQKLSEMIRQLNRERGYTFCIIEHDMDLIASLCDPVIVLAGGRLLMQGTIEEVRADERVIDAYFGGEEAA